MSKESSRSLVLAAAQKLKGDKSTEAIDLLLEVVEGVVSVHGSNIGEILPQLGRSFITNAAGARSSSSLELICAEALQ